MYSNDIYVYITTCYENKLKVSPALFVWIRHEICRNLSRHVIKLLPPSFISLRQNKDWCIRLTLRSFVWERFSERKGFDSVSIKLSQRPSTTERTLSVCVGLWLEQHILLTMTSYKGTVIEVSISFGPSFPLIYSKIKLGFSLVYFFHSLNTIEKHQNQQTIFKRYISFIPINKNTVVNNFDILVFSYNLKSTF